MPRSIILFSILLSLLLLPLVVPLTEAVEAPAEDKNAALVKILEEAYGVSCNEADRLGDYYRSDALIIHDGRQTTLSETIQEIKESFRALKDIRCGYHPRVKSSRVLPDIAYLIVRETILISAEAAEPQAIEQICSYIFTKDASRWKIAVDHCSTVPGETI